MGTLSLLQDILDLRFCGEGDKLCSECRYHRIHTTGCAVSECILLGRTMAMGDKPIEEDHRTCNGWHWRPEHWEINSSGVGNNPHWKDPYISRDKQFRIRMRVLAGEIGRLQLEIRRLRKGKDERD